MRPPEHNLGGVENLVNSGWYKTKKRAFNMVVEVENLVNSGGYKTRWYKTKRKSAFKVFCLRTLLIQKGVKLACRASGVKLV